jgi:hypothetical protein
MMRSMPPRTLLVAGRPRYACSAVLLRPVVRVRASIVVAAYNEERNIAGLLQSILDQRLAAAELHEIVVVASGCTDATHTEVERVARTDARIRLLVQPTRLGKVSAINAYLAERDPSCEVVVICSADVCLHPGCLEHLLERFVVEPSLGMTGGRPIPNNRRDTVLGEVVHILWELHHERASQAPKLGEIVAIRSRIMQPLTSGSPVDEASAEALVEASGHTLRYIPDALVTNHGPENLREYFVQRRRINAGHYWLKGMCGYEPSTFNWRRVVPLALRRLSLRRPRQSAALVLAAAVEIASRIAGRVDLRLGRSHAIWAVSESARPRLEIERGRRPPRAARITPASSEPPSGR